MRSSVDILLLEVPLAPSVSTADPLGLGRPLPLPFALMDGLLPLRPSCAMRLCDMFDPLRPRSPCRPGQVIWEVGSGSESALVGKVMTEGRGG